MGVAVFAALSDGIHIAPANYGKKALHSLGKAQRDLSAKSAAAPTDAKQSAASREYKCG
jgi:hypothetical protein